MDLIAIRECVDGLIDTLSRLTPDELNERFKLKNSSVTQHKMEAQEALGQEIKNYCGKFGVTEVRLFMPPNDPKPGMTPVEEGRFVPDLVINFNPQTPICGTLSYELSQSLGEWLHTRRQSDVAHRRSAQLTSEQSYAVAAIAAITEEDKDEVVKRLFNRIVLEELMRHRQSPDDMLHFHRLGFYQERLSQVAEALRGS